MSQQFSNAARTELAAGILAGDTTFALADGQVFPDANNGNAAIGTGTWFKATLQDPDGIEIVYVRTHNTGTTPNGVSHVLRGQEGTVARAFAAGTTIGLRVTAGDMADLWATMATKAPTSHTHTIANVTGLQSALDGKATDSVALTDAAGTATLPATAAASVVSRLQVLRNNIKQAFADLGNKQAALVSGTNIKTVGGQSLLGSGNVPTGEPLPTATIISRTGGVIASMTETVGGTSRVTTITRSGGVVTQIAIAHNGTTRTETLTRTNGRVTGITVTET